MKKLFLIPLSILMVGLVLGGCGQPATPTTTPQTTPTTTTPTAPTATTQVVPKELKLMDNFPPQPGSSNQGLIDWENEFQERTGIKLNISYGAMGQQSLIDALETGVCDIAKIDATWQRPGVFPISEVVELPWVVPSAAAMAKASLALYRNGFLDSEYGENTKLKPLHMELGAGGQILSSKPINTLADLKGRKIATGSPLKDALYGLLGVVPVTIPIQDLTIALQKGTIDGTISPPDMQVLNLFESCKYRVGPSFGEFLHIYCMNRDVWNKLPPDIQGTIDDMFEEYSLNYAVKYDMYVVEVSDVKYLNEQGGHVRNWSPEEMAEIGRLWAPIWENWIAEWQEKGVTVRPAIDAFYQYMLEAGVTDPTSGAYIPAGAK